MAHCRCHGPLDFLMVPSLSTSFTQKDPVQIHTTADGVLAFPFLYRSVHRCLAIWSCVIVWTTVLHVRTQASLPPHFRSAVSGPSHPQKAQTFQFFMFCSFICFHPFMASDVRDSRRVLYMSERRNRG